MYNLKQWKKKRWHWKWGLDSQTQYRQTERKRQIWGCAFQCCKFSGLNVVFMYGIIVIIIIIDSHAYRSMANSYAATLRMGISFTHATTLFTIGNSIMKIVIYKSFELRRHTRISTTYNVFRGRERTTKCHIRITWLVRPQREKM